MQTVQVPVYSEQEYQLYLHDDAWTKAETDHLFDLARRFDLRFVVIHDRYDHQQFKVSTGVGWGLGLPRGQEPGTLQITFVRRECRSPAAGHVVLAAHFIHD